LHARSESNRVSFKSGVKEDFTELERSIRLTGTTIEETATYFDDLLQFGVRVRTKEHHAPQPQSGHKRMIVRKIVWKRFSSPNLQEKKRLSTLEKKPKNNLE
jgi:hypothetical protein